MSEIGSARKSGGLAGRKRASSVKTGRLTAKKQDSRWIELFVYGISLGSEHQRPVLILKSKDGMITLPVWLNPIDASFALSNFNHQAHAAQAVTRALMERLHLRLERCVFTGIRGHHQFVTLHFSGNEKLTRLDVRADEAMSLCLAESVRFFAMPDFVERCRDVNEELLRLGGSNLQSEIGTKNQRYMM